MSERAEKSEGSRLYVASVDTQGDYCRVIEGLTARWRATPRGVLRDIFKPPRGLFDEAARNADDGVRALRSSDPPAEHLATHNELTEALEQFGRDLHEIAKRKDLRGAPRMLREARDRPSYDRFIRAWQTAREDCRSRL